MALLEQRVKDEVIRLPDVELVFAIGDQKDPKYCPYHQKKGYSLNCATHCRELLIKGIRMEILFQEGYTGTNNLPFPKHDDRGKAHAMMASHHEIDIEGAQSEVLEDESDLDKMAQQVHNFVKFRYFHYQIGFTPY